MAVSPRQCNRTHSLDHSEVFVGENFAMLVKPLYSPDLASCNFLFFPKLKVSSKEHIFQTGMLSKAPRQRGFEGASKNCCRNALMHGKEIEKCIRLKGDYFKGNNM